MLGESLVPVSRGLPSLPDLTEKNFKISLRQLLPSRHPAADCYYVLICSHFRWWVNQVGLLWAPPHGLFPAVLLLDMHFKGISINCGLSKRGLEVGLGYFAIERWKFRWKNWKTSNLLSALSFLKLPSLRPLHQHVLLPVQQKLRLELGWVAPPGTGVWHIWEASDQPRDEGWCWGVEDDKIFGLLVAPGTQINHCAWQQWIHNENVIYLMSKWMKIHY